MAQMSIEEIANLIASDTGTPPAIVSAMCEATWKELSEGARITDFLTVLVIKRVREDLRRGGRGRRSGSAEQIDLFPSEGRECSIPAIGAGLMRTKGHKKVSFRITQRPADEMAKKTDAWARRLGKYPLPVRGRC